MRIIRKKDAVDHNSGVYCIYYMLEILFMRLQLVSFQMDHLHVLQR